MTSLIATSPIVLESAGLRGESPADTARRVYALGSVSDQAALEYALARASISPTGAVQQAIAEAASQRLSINGGSLFGLVNMQGNRLENLGAPDTPEDAARFQDVLGAAAQRLAVTGGSLFGLLNMQGNRVENIGAPDTTDDAARLRDVIDTTNFAVASERQSLLRSIGTSGFEAMGRPRERAPVAGVPFNDRTFVFLDPFEYGGSVDGILLYALKPGPVYFSTWRKVGGTFERLSEITLQVTGAGLATFINGDASGFEGLPHGPGEYFGFCAADGVLTFNSSPPDGSGIIAAPSRTLQFPDSNIVYDTVRAQIRIESGYSEQPLSSAEVLRSIRPPARPLPTCYYMFLIAGQSNMVGFSEMLSADVPYETSFTWNGTGFVYTADPVGAAPAGSPWAAFANEFYRRTGFGTILVPTAVSGSAMIAEADEGAGNWSATGSLRGASVTSARNAMAATSLPYQFGGILWGQGERDADYIAAGHSVAAYEAGFEDLLTFYRNEFGPSCPFIIARTGTRPDGSAPVSWQQVRDAQDAKTRVHGNVFMGWTGAKSLRTRGLMNPDGSYHYKQAAYDEMGRSMATVASAVSLGQA